MVASWLFMNNAFFCSSDLLKLSSRRTSSAEPGSTAIDQVLGSPPHRVRTDAIPAARQASWRRTGAHRLVRGGRLAEERDPSRRPAGRTAVDEVEGGELVVSDKAAVHPGDLATRPSGELDRFEDERRGHRGGHRAGDHTAMTATGRVGVVQAQITERTRLCRVSNAPTAPTALVPYPPYHDVRVLHQVLPHSDVLTERARLLPSGLRAHAVATRGAGMVCLTASSSNRRPAASRCSLEQGRPSSRGAGGPAEASPFAGMASVKIEARLRAHDGLRAQPGTGGRPAVEVSSCRPGGAQGSYAVHLYEHGGRTGPSPAWADSHKVRREAVDRELVSLHITPSRTCGTATLLNVWQLRSEQIKHGRCQSERTGITSGQRRSTVRSGRCVTR